MIHLFLKILINPYKPLSLPTSVQIFTFNKLEPQYRLDKQFSKQNIILINQLKELHWIDILFRKIRVISLPPKKNDSTADRIKRSLIRYLYLSINTEIEILSIHHFIFLENEKNILLAYSAHCCEIYRAHLKHFKIIETPKKYRRHILFSFYLLCNLLKYRHTDKRNGTTVFSNPISPYLIYSFQNLHPHKRLIVRYHDMVTKRDIKIIQTIKKKKPNIQIETYSHTDAIEHSITYRANGVDPTFMKPFNADFRNALYRFYGSIGGSKSPIKNRLDQLPLLNETLSQIYPFAHLWIDYKIIDSIYNLMPYNEFVKQSALCEVYVDIARTKLSEGFSFRIAEALFLNRKILTNRTCLINEPFYDPNRIFIIGKDSPRRLKSFLESDLPPLPENILRMYDSSLWWTNKDPYKLECSEPIR